MTNQKRLNYTLDTIGVISVTMRFFTVFMSFVIIKSALRAK